MLVGLWPNKKRSRVCVKKRQNGGQISQKALRVLFPLQWWNRLLRGEVPSFLTMNFPFIESRNKCFLILYTRFWRSYKLSMEHIRLLQPNTRVVYVVYASFVFSTLAQMYSRFCGYLQFNIFNTELKGKKCQDFSLLDNCR